MKDKHRGNSFLLISGRFWHAHAHWFICMQSKSSEDPESTLNLKQLKRLCQLLPFHSDILSLTLIRQPITCLLANKASTSEVRLECCSERKEPHLNSSMLTRCPLRYSSRGKLERDSVWNDRASGIYFDFELQGVYGSPWCRAMLCCMLWCAHAFFLNCERESERSYSIERYEVGGCWSSISVLHSVLILYRLSREVPCTQMPYILFSFCFNELLFFLMQYTHLNTFAQILCMGETTKILCCNPHFAKFMKYSYAGFICQAVISICAHYCSLVFTIKSLNVVLKFRVKVIFI